MLSLRGQILDYARTAEQIAAMAQGLDALVKDTGNTVAAQMNQRLSELRSVSGRARADAISVLNHAALLAAGLIVLALA